MNKKSSNSGKGKLSSESGKSLEKDWAESKLMGAFPSVRSVPSLEFKALVKERVRKKLYTSS